MDKPENITWHETIIEVQELRMAFSYNLQGLATISQQEKETLSPTTTKKNGILPTNDLELDPSVVNLYQSEAPPNTLNAAL